MEEESLNDLVRFLSEESLTDITVAANIKEDTEFGTFWNLKLFVHASDPGESRLYRSKVGPAAEIYTTKHEMLEDGTQLYEQTLSSPLACGAAVIKLYCQNTRFFIVEDQSQKKTDD